MLTYASSSSADVYNRNVRDGFKTAMQADVAFVSGHLDRHPGRMTGSSAAKKNIWLVFALVFSWKVALLVFSTQPVPSNDSFFYDGAVVNYLQNGGYFNPSLALALPISSTEVFCAYPPLYQAVLLGWMSVFGTSAVSAMAMHLVLFGVYMLILLAIFRRLQTPPWCVHMAGLFLLLITFHDRPDSLAYVLGMAAVYAWIRSRKMLGGESSPAQSARWTWLMVLFVILCFTTSLQIGAIYFFWMWVGMVATTLLGGEQFPKWPMLVMCVVPIGLVFFVKLAFPHLWTGFLEHARQAPSLTGLRHIYLDDLLKIGRSVPGILLAAVLLPWLWLKQRRDFDTPVAIRHELMLVPALLTGLAVVAACMVLVVANAVVIANYLQPLVVAGYLTVCGAVFEGQRRLRVQINFFLAALLLGSIRAVGMSTWGLACAADVSYWSAIHRVSGELNHRPPGFKAVISSAYLYEAARHKNITWIHSDWLRKAKGSPYPSDLEAFEALKPDELILTQFDYNRRYRRMLEYAKSDPDLMRMDTEDTAKTRAPDSIPLLHRVVQHISWAPVIVKVEWRGQGSEAK